MFYIKKGMFKYDFYIPVTGNFFIPVSSISFCSIFFVISPSCFSTFGVLLKKLLIVNVNSWLNETSNSTNSSLNKYPSFGVISCI